MAEESGTVKESGSEPVRPWRLLRFFLFIAIIAALVPVAYAGWRDLYSRFLEKSAPRIRQDDAFPRGIGQAPVRYRFDVRDGGAGLDEVVVRLRQKGRSYELLRRSLKGERQAGVEVQLPDEKVPLEEGSAMLEIKAFDRSFWSNASEEKYEIAVDFRKPEIEVLTTQHNAVAGGSQLIIYKAYDENLTLSGVKAGKRTFEGFPAKGLDPGFGDYPSVYAAIYAIPADEAAGEIKVKLFAEDLVGNASSRSFFNKIAPRRWREVSLDVKEGMLREQVGMLAEQNFEKLRAQAQEAGAKLERKGMITSAERLVEDFKLVNERLRRANDYQIQSLVAGKRSSRLWEGPFLMQNGIVQLAYGTRITYRFAGEVIGSAFQQGYELRAARGDRGVVAANSGVVIFSDNIGVYGRALGVDHGFGLISIYGQLESVLVNVGEAVESGQLIAHAGRSGLARGPDVYFEMRVQGVPVDAREWWDKEWYFGHILGKIDEVKKALGVQSFRPF